MHQLCKQALVLLSNADINDKILDLEINRLDQQISLAQQAANHQVQIQTFLLNKLQELQIQKEEKLEFKPTVRPQNLRGEGDSRLLLKDCNWEEGATWLRSVQIKVTEIEQNIAGKIKAVREEIEKRRRWGQLEKERILNKIRAINDQLAILNRRLQRR